MRNAAALPMCLLVAAGCSSSAAIRDAGPMSDASPQSDAAVDGPGHTPGMPGLGAHGLAFHRLTDARPDLGNLTTIATPAMATQASGSTIVVAVAHGVLAAFDLPNAAPTDNQGNAPYQQLGSTQKYERWDSGTGLYAVTSARGGPDHTVTAVTPVGDEVTLAAIEVIEGTRIQDFQWNDVSGDPHTSLAVTTTGPATLIAFWWGDGFVESGYTATPNNGFHVVDSVLEGGSLIQCAVAVKNVSAAGTYDVTWEATPPQGAQLWLVAVQ